MPKKTICTPVDKLPPTIFISDTALRNYDVIKMTLKS